MKNTVMKSYLDLIPIAAKTRRKQNRLTLVCIVPPHCGQRFVCGGGSEDCRQQGGVRLGMVSGIWGGYLRGISD